MTGSGNAVTIQPMGRFKQKLYRFEVDQSVRIEELIKDTIIGLANKEQGFTLVLPVSVKRKLHEQFRREGKPKQFGWKIFAAAVTVTVRKSQYKLQDIIVDIEYPGYEREIRQFIQRRVKVDTIYFRSIGKKSPAHLAAYGVYSKRMKVNVRTNIRELLNILNNGSRTVTPPDKSRTIRSPR